MSTTSLGEVIQLLSFAVPLASDQSFETNKVILSEFSSASVTVFSNQKASLTISFSNDSINFDYTVTNSIDANKAKTITTVVVGKWCKISLFNNSGNPLNSRLTTYCSTQPSTVQSSVNSIDDNFQSVNIDNWSATLNNAINVAQQTIITTHKFVYSSIDPLTFKIQGPDKSFRTFYVGGIIPSATNPFIEPDKSLALYDIYKASLGGTLYCKGEPAVFRSGDTMFTQFNILLNTGGYNFPVNEYDQLMIGMGAIDEASGNPTNGVFLGYPSTGSKDFSIILYQNGIETAIIPQRDFLFDSLDGRGPSRVLLDTSKFTTWKMRCGTIGTSSIYIELHNPIDNEYIPVHRIQKDNLFEVQNFENTSFSFVVYSRRTTSQPGSGIQDVYISTGGGYLAKEIGFESRDRLQSFGTSGAVNNILANTETTVLACRAGELLNNFENNAKMDMLKLSVTADGNRPVIFKIYVAEDTDFIAPVWFYPNQILTPGQGLINNNSFKVGSGILVFTGYVQKDGVALFELDEFEIWLFRKDSVIVTATSVLASEVNTAFTYNLVE